MSLERQSHWLDAYGKAWEARDPEAFAALFAEDAIYHWGPFSEPLRGRRAIEERTRSAVLGQADVRFGFEPLALTEDGRGISRWWVSYRVVDDGSVEEDEGVFLVTLDGEGLFSEFREWWNTRRTPSAT